PIFLGQAYWRLGDLARAERELSVALETHPDDRTVLRQVSSLKLAQNKIAEAETLLQHMLDVSGQRDDWKLDDDARWARRTLAEVWARPSSGQPMEKALALLEENSIDGVLAPQSEVLYTALCAARPEFRFRQMALARLQQRRTTELADNQLFLL